MHCSFIVNRHFIGKNSLAYVMYATPIGLAYITYAKVHYLNVSLTHTSLQHVTKEGENNSKANDHLRNRLITIITI